MQMDRAQQRVDEQLFRLTGSWQVLLHAKNIRLQQLHNRLLQQSSFQALRTRGERCTSATQRLHSIWQIRLFAAHRIVEVLSGDLLLHSPYHCCLRLRQAIAHLESRGNRAIMSNI
jgi:exonuclease VII large subunit